MNERLVAALLATSLVTSITSAQAQRVDPGSACPTGTHYATIRHNQIKPGQWSTFQGAVTAHNAWYAGHGNKTTTGLSRVIVLERGTPALSTANAVTITRYTAAAQPAHDAAYDAFIAKYRASSTAKDEARVCL